MGKLKHLAIIPDGNRRWAKKRGLPEWRGHQKGKERAEEIAKAVFKAGIPYFTFWALSEDNLVKRSKVELYFLFKLLSQAIKKWSSDSFIKKEKVRIRFFGKWEKLMPKTLISEIKAIQKKTEANDKNFLSVMLAYDGRSEMIEAIEKLSQNKKLLLNFNDVKNNLWTADLPEVDLAIRTGGEPHWSAGFMMWHTANSQFYFTEKFWPDFDEKELERAIGDYGRRERRGGK